MNARAHTDPPSTFYDGRGARSIPPPCTAEFGRHHSRKSSGASSLSGGHAPPAMTDSTSATVRGQRERFSTYGGSAETTTSSSRRTPPVPRSAAILSGTRKGAWYR